MRTASSTETAVHNNQAAIQALSAPLQAINQAFPLIQQQTEDTALAVRAVHDEAHDSRQDSLDFRAKVLMELTKLAERVDSSPTSLERTITMTLARHSAGMNQLQHDLQFAHSKGTGEVVAKLEAIVCTHPFSDNIRLTETRIKVSKVFRLVLSASRALCGQSARRMTA